VSRWTCPACEREFGRAHQAHVCVPGCTVDECFQPWPAAWRQTYDALIKALRSLGPVHEDAVRVGVFLKSDHKLAEVRPKARSLQLAVLLPRKINSPRVSRVLSAHGGMTVHVVNLTAPDQVDDELSRWLAEAYHAATVRLADQGGPRRGTHDHGPFRAHSTGLVP
jgi:hypothetical protein